MKSVIKFLSWCLPSLQAAAFIFSSNASSAQIHRDFPNCNADWVNAENTPYIVDFSGTSDGYVWAVGNIDKNYIVKGFGLITKKSDGDGFLAKIDSLGNWTEVYQLYSPAGFSTGRVDMQNVAVTKDRVYIQGERQRKLIIGNDTLPACGNDNFCGFVASFDKASKTWVETYSYSTFPEFTDMAVTDSSLYLLMTQQSSFSLYGHNFPSSLNYNTALMALNTRDFSFKWGYSHEDSIQNKASRILVKNDRVFFTGNKSDFNQTGGFIECTDTAGTFLWKNAATPISTLKYPPFTGLAIDPNGDLIIGGNTSNGQQARYDSDTANSYGAHLVRIDASGQWKGCSKAELNGEIIDLVGDDSGNIFFNMRLSFGVNMGEAITEAGTVCGKFQNLNEAMWLISMRDNNRVMYPKIYPLSADKLAINASLSQGCCQIKMDLGEDTISSSSSGNPFTAIIGPSIRKLIRPEIYDVISKFGTGGAICQDGSGNVYYSNEVASVTIDGTTYPGPYLAKLDAFGKVVWITKYSKSNTGYEKAVVDNQGNLYLCGVDNIKFVLTKFNSSGTELWSIVSENTFGPSTDVSQLILDASQQYIYLTGAISLSSGTASFGGLTMDKSGAFILKVDVNGNAVKCFQGSGYGGDKYTELTMHNNSLYIGGFTNKKCVFSSTISYTPTYNGYTRSFILKMDTSFKPLKAFGETTGFENSVNTIQGLQVRNSNEIYALIAAENLNWGTYTMGDIFMGYALLKLDSTGTIKDSATIGVIDTYSPGANEIFLQEDGIAIGLSNSYFDYHHSRKRFKPTDETAKAFLMVDFNLTPLWYKPISGFKNLLDLDYTNKRFGLNGGYSGYVEGSGIGVFADGLFDCGEQFTVDISERKYQVSESVQFGDLKAWPNPTSATLTVAIPKEARYKGNTIRVFNLLGKEIMQIPVDQQEKVQIDLQDFPKGYYIISTQIGSEKLSGKIVKL